MIKTLQIILTRFNSLDEATISHEFIPQNILTSILPSNIHVKAKGAKNIAMPILGKSYHREIIKIWEMW